MYDLYDDTSEAFLSPKAVISANAFSNGGNSTALSPSGLSYNNKPSSVFVFDDPLSAHASAD